ncbi:type II toxin-antitoxin system RelE/ParE family toxin [Candidatus Bathyarchaeota archaeon]|nr:type II toxin-antitoxin system RelE/ParE family toxin [Candidatus Bathyarchaeota archaeon]
MLKGVLSDIRKIRVYDYRVAYKIHSSNKTIEVFFVDHRKRAYQKLKQLRREEVIQDSHNAQKHINSESDSSIRCVL